MKSLLKNRDFISGACFIALGLFVSYKANNDYAVGSLASMGPGYFPLLLGVVLSIVGLVIVALSVIIGSKEMGFQITFGWRPVAGVLLGIWIFSQLIGRVGLVPSTLALTLIAATAEKPYRLKRTLLLGSCLGAIAWLIFIVGLDMNLSTFKWGD